MAKAVWRGQVIAESDRTEKVDGYTYFPPDAVHWNLLEESRHTSVCMTKGVASYYDVVIEGVRNDASAWCYREPAVRAQAIRGWIGFWKGIRIG
jgi:uncharacterized protein (DUF427 family)